VVLLIRVQVLLLHLQEIVVQVEAKQKVIRVEVLLLGVEALLQKVEVRHLKAEVLLLEVADDSCFLLVQGNNRPLKKGSKIKSFYLF